MRARRQRGTGEGARLDAQGYAENRRRRHGVRIALWGIEPQMLEALITDAVETKSAVLRVLLRDYWRRHEFAASPLPPLPPKEGEEHWFRLALSAGEAEKLGKLAKQIGTSRVRIFRSLIWAEYRKRVAAGQIDDAIEQAEWAGD